MLTEAADYVRPLLDRSNPIGDRLCALWAALVSARDLGASDVVEGEFLQLARDTRTTGPSRWVVGRRHDVNISPP
jgi:hypothetical protein